MKQRILHIGCSAGGHPYNGLQRAFIDHAIEYHDINCGVLDLNIKILELLKTFTPEIVFLQIQTDGIIAIDTVKALKNTGAKVYNFTGDVRDPIPQFYYDLAPHVTSTMFTNMTDVETMREAGYRSDFLELGFDETIYCPEGPVTKCEDIVFMGNHYGNFPMSGFRKEMVEFLRANFPNFGVYGNGWDHCNGNLNHSQPEEAAKYRGAKIAINVSHFEHKQYSSDRLLRILGTGTLCLCKRFPELEKRFTPDFHLIEWDTLEELAYLCNYYLDNEEGRKRIAHEGKRLAHSTYTFHHMVKNLLCLH